MAKAGISTGASKIGNEAYRTAGPDALMEYSAAVGTLPILYPAGFRQSVKTPPVRPRNPPRNALFKSAGKCTILCTGMFSRNVITLMLFSSWCPCRQDITVIVSSSFSFPHFSLPAFSITSLQLVSFAVVLHSPPTLSRYLLMQSFHRILGFPRLFFPSTFWASALFANFVISHSFHMSVCTLGIFACLLILRT